MTEEQTIDYREKASKTKKIAWIISFVVVIGMILIAAVLFIAFLGISIS